MALVTRGKFQGEWCDVIVWMGDEVGIIVNNTQRQFIHIKFVLMSLDEALDLQEIYNFRPYSSQYYIEKTGRGYKIKKYDS